MHEKGHSEKNDKAETKAVGFILAGTRIYAEPRHAGPKPI